MGQLMQTMHMLTKPQVFYNESHKTALGYQNPLYLTQAQRKEHASYCGHIIFKEHDALSIIDTEETLILAKESSIEMHADVESKCVLPANNNHLQYDEREKCYIHQNTKVLDLEVELLKKENDRLLELIISQDIVHTVVNTLATIANHRNMEHSYLDEYNENLELLAELAKKIDMVEKALEAHVDYLKHTQKHDDTLHRIFEQARALQPLDSTLDSSCNVKHSVLNVNSKLICATCNECIFDAIHDLCVLDYLIDLNVRAKPKSVKSKKKKAWKPTGKVFTNVGYRWKLTGRTFTIDGNTFPLSRITSTILVPPKKPLSTTIVKKTPPSSNSLGNLKDITNIGSSSKSKVVQIILWYLDSGCPKHMTGQRSQLINFVSKFMGTVRFGNDHVAAIMGYGDYQIGNVMISWVYYVEGSGHNLFSVRQFCDSNLEVAFRKHTCYVCDLEGVELLHYVTGRNDAILSNFSLV
ncbi:hypothetical protein Tco_1458086 [Tanacetum coccineum]